MDVFTGLWIVIGVAAGVIEGAALINRKKGDTFTEKFRRLTAINRFTRTVIFFIWVWLTAHLWLNPGWI